MNDETVSEIEAYINEHLFEPSEDWPYNEFVRRSYARCFAQDIVKRIKASPDRWASDTLAEYINKMDEFVEKSDRESSNLVFKVGRDTAEDIWELIIPF